jgi:hypothetical protein
VKRLILILALALLPTVALAQGQTMKIDCTAYRRNPDGLWTVIHTNVIVLDGKSITVDMTNACCFGSDRSRLVLGGVNLINIVEKACY